MDADKCVGQHGTGLGIGLAIEIPLGLLVGLGEDHDRGLAFHVLEGDDGHGVAVLGHSLGDIGHHAREPELLTLGNLLVDGSLAGGRRGLVAGIDLRQRELARLAQGVLVRAQRVVGDVDAQNVALL